MNVTPHVAAKAKGSAIDGRTTGRKGYALSQHVRKRIEEIFGWAKTVGPVAKTMLRGVERVGPHTFTLAAYNLARVPNCSQHKEIQGGGSRPQANRLREASGDSAVLLSPLFQQPVSPTELQSRDFQDCKVLRTDL